MSIKKKLQSGFTLVELMIVVAIIGILAVLAIYGVKKYIANSKTAEARQSLGRLAKDAAAAYESERMNPAIQTEGSSTEVTRDLCDTATAAVPGAIGDVAGKKYQSSAAEWKVDEGALTKRAKGFACLRFEINTPQYYQYNYTKGGVGADSTMQAAAYGDLDGNGAKSEFLLNGKIQSARLTLAPQLVEVNPEE